MIVFLVLVVSLLVVGTVRADDTKTPDISNKIIGTWQLTKGIVGGNPFPDSVVKNIRLELTEGKYILSGAESPDQGTWILHSDQKPLGLDVTGTDGPNKGKTYLAIVQLRGDKMKVCYDLSGQTRPVKFESKKNTPLFLAEYKRVK